MNETIQRLAIAVFVVATAISAVQEWNEDTPVIASDYYTQAQTGASIEAEYSALGEYEVSYIDYPAVDYQVERYAVWYPSQMTKEDDKLWPIVVVSNGTGVAASRYAPFFRHLASWGFVVIGNEQQNAWSGASASDGLDLLIQLNEDESSIFYHKLDTECVGATGHSQGAIGAINAVTVQENGWRYKALYTASTPSSRYSAALGWAYDSSLIEIPCFMAAGTGLLDAGEAGAPDVSQDMQELSISPLWSQEENYGLISDQVPKLRARRTGADHADMLFWGDGYMTAWFMYWLQGDTAAGEAFFGDDAEILTNSLWQDIETNL